MNIQDAWEWKDAWQTRSRAMEPMTASRWIKGYGITPFFVKVTEDDEYFSTSAEVKGVFVTGGGTSLEEAFAMLVVELGKVLDDRDPVELAIWNMPENPSISHVALIADAMNVEDVSVVTWLRKRKWNKVETVESLVKEWETT